MMRRRHFAMVVVAAMAVTVLSACSALPSAVATLETLTRPAAGSASVPANAPEAATVTQAAQRQTVQTVQLAELQDDLVQVYDLVNPSVVNIRVISGAPSDLPDGQGLPGSVAQGSGFVWDKQGHIVTNNHVVDGGDRITVTFTDGMSLKAELVGRDPASDLAVLKIDPAKVDLKPIAVMDSTQVKVGQLAVAIGNPFGLEGSMSFGIVSALGRTLDPSSGASTFSGGYTIPDIIQTDAPVNPGNSGGVLVDLQGNLIGVPTAIESPVRASSGVGFAVPSVIVQKVVPELIANGKFVHPYIGISGTTLTSELALAMNLSETQRGALVATVSAGGPAEKAGLIGSEREVQIEGFPATVGGDVIVAIDGQPVRDFEDLVTYLGRYGTVGQEVTLTILRNGSEQKLPLVLAARPSESATVTTRRVAPPQQPAPAGAAWLGVSTLSMTPELAQAMNLPDATTGALVAEVVQGSPAEISGLRAGTEQFDLNGQSVMIGGDIITAVDGREVAGSQALGLLVRAQEPGDRIELTVLRGGRTMRIEVELGERPSTN